MAQPNRTALITGASSGIGASFAQIFARNQYDLVLVARREDKLNDLAEKIRNQHQVEVTVSVADLSAPNASKDLVHNLVASNLHIDALINNAGFAIQGDFLDLTWDQHMAMQQVMLTGYTELCYLLAPAMKERGYGRIINVSSAAAITPPLRGSLYSAIKSYIVDFTISLDYELRESGIHASVICPGFTRTEFQDTMGITDNVSGVPDFMWQSADEVAQEGYDAVMNGQVFKVNGMINRFIGSIFKLMPRALTLYVGRRIEVIPQE